VFPPRLLFAVVVLLVEVFEVVYVLGFSVFLTTIWNVSTLPKFREAVL
jgi:hypothetical protein